MLVYLLIIPFALQGILMLADEFYFHHRRDLPRWERLGHPLDTLVVLLCFLTVLYAPITSGTLWLYGLMSLASLLMVTKDEWVHQQYCSGGEFWIHSLLFLLHPMILIFAALIWPFVRVEQVTDIVIQNFSDITAGAILGLVDLGVGKLREAVIYLRLHTLLTATFLLYQIIYWLLWRKNGVAHQQ